MIRRPSRSRNIVITAMRTAATSAVRRAASGEGSMNTFNIVLRWPEIQRVLVKEA
jgi:hypothetical protein|tara:strand:+ start:316 stop:480 length:165 start_codon:yes stop_codon:yes gene_type:complete